MSNETSNSEPRQAPLIRDFNTLIAALGYGQVTQGLSEKIQEIVQAITEEHANTGRVAKGELVLKLKFAADETVEIVPEVTTKMPKPTYGKAVYWPTADGHLTTSNPKQGTLFGVRDVSGHAQPARTVGAPAL